MRNSYRVLLTLAILLAVASFLFPTGASAASSGHYYSLNYDGTLFSSGDNYTDIQTATSGTAEYTTTTVRVGQDNTTGICKVWRAVFFFDTTDLPEGAVISSAFVTFRGYANGSTTDFNLVLVQPGDMNSPMVGADYGTIYSKTTALNDTFSSASYSSSMQLTLNGAGEAALMHEGITVLGLRSYEDITASAPTNAEYMDIYSSESSYPPILTISYYATGLLGTPDDITLSSVAVYGDYYQTGDELYVMRVNVNYEFGIDDLDSLDYFTVQLSDNTGVLASVPLWSWGYVPASIYLSAANALGAGTYTLTVIGEEDKFTVEVPNTSHTILNTEHKGTDMDSLDRWVMSTAIDIGRKEKSDVDYYRTQVSGKWVLNDIGGDMFLSGIPLLDSRRPHLFANPSTTETETDHGDSYSGTLWGNWGPKLSDDWEALGDIIGTPGLLLATLAFLVFGGYVVTVVQKETGKPALGMIPAAGVLLLGAILGVPLFIILGATAIAAAYFYKELFMGSTA